MNNYRRYFYLELICKAMVAKETGFPLEMLTHEYYFKDECTKGTVGYTPATNEDFLRIISKKD